MIFAAVGIAIAYLCASLPFGLILARVIMKEDLRQLGSGNIGATNALRAGGTLLGVSTLLLDAGKGAVGYLLGAWLASRSGPPSPGVLALLVLAPVLGHCYPVWLAFRGGKGVATALGTLAVVDPMLLAVALVTFLIVVFPTRYVSLGSMIAAGAAAGVSLWRHGIGGVSWGIALLALVILLRHRENIARLITGSERKLGQRAMREDETR